MALNFLRALWELNHAIERSSRVMQKRHGVTGPERLFLRIVGQKPGITPAEVAAILRVHRSSVSPLIKKMERRRLVGRHPNKADRRSFHMRLTAAGRRIDTMRTGTIEEVVRRTVLAADPADVAVTSALLVTLAQRLTSGLQRRT
jgi:DNA-binding MarR family transcriptional regulator